MIKSKSNTKTGNLTAAFKSLAATNAEESLAYMFMSAFGIALSTLLVIVNKICTTADVQLAILSLTAGVQIRNHVTYVGSEFGSIRVKFPELIIEGERGLEDQFNFGALHAMGHLFAHLSQSSLAKKVLDKSGSCITGAGVNDSEAGKINKEMSESWSTEDKVAWTSWNAANSVAHATFIGALFEGIPKKATDFTSGMQGKGVPKTAPVRPPAASASSSVPPAAKPAAKEDASAKVASPPSLQ